MIEGPSYGLIALMGLERENGSARVNRRRFLRFTLKGGMAAVAVTALMCKVGIDIRDSIRGRGARAIWQKIKSAPPGWQGLLQNLRSLRAELDMQGLPLTNIVSEREFIATLRTHLPLDDLKRLPPLSDDLYPLVNAIKNVADAAGAPRSLLVPDTELLPIIRPHVLACWEKAEECEAGRIAKANEFEVRHGACADFWVNIGDSRLQLGGYTRNQVGVTLERSRKLFDPHLRALWKRLQEGSTNTVFAYEVEGIAWILQESEWGREEKIENQSWRRALVSAAQRCFTEAEKRQGEWQERAAERRGVEDGIFGPRRVHERQMRIDLLDERAETQFVDPLKLEIDVILTPLWRMNELLKEAGAGRNDPDVGIPDTKLRSILENLPVRPEVREALMEEKN